jgi:translation initiation factor IF-2
MQFLEGRQDRAKKESKEQSEHNSKNPAQKRLVTLPATLPAEGLSLVETSTLFRIKIDDMLKKLDSIGISTAGTEGKGISLDIDTLEVLAMEFDIETVRGEEEIVMDHNELLMQQRRADDAVVHPPRPPVVCIMGHVDHGKTTLMDALRRKSTNQQDSKVKKSKGKKKNGVDGKASADVAGTEAGGITQTISAFQVDVEGQDSKVTFLDTPGHAAFKTMRQSGSHAADVIVLVVAADDGVSEQTIEILDFYKSIVMGSHGGITMVVALNKIDKPGIEVTEAKRRIENQLLEQGIICEGMGGESEFGPPVQIIPTSGLTGEGLDELIEGLLLQSEVMDLRADHEAHAEGIVMDARMEKGLGVVADCIIRWGSIRKGDHIVSGTQASRVRMLKDGEYTWPQKDIFLVVFSLMHLFL